MGVENFTEVGTKVVAIGFNYPTVAEGFIDIPEVPLIFLKAKSSYITEGQEIVIPPDCKEVIHEVELGVVIGKRAKNIKKEEVFDYVAGYCAVNDITDVAFLRTALKKGTHWILAKSCDTFCPVSRFVPKEKIKDPDNVEIYCLVNGEEKQRDNTGIKAFDVPTILEYITKYITLEPGDLVLTGTPVGSTIIHPGDKVEMGITGVVHATFYVKK